MFQQQQRNGILQLKFYSRIQKVQFPLPIVKLTRYSKTKSFGILVLYKITVLEIRKDGKLIKAQEETIKLLNIDMLMIPNMKKNYDYYYLYLMSTQYRVPSNDHYIRDLENISQRERHGLFNQPPPLLVGDEYNDALKSQGKEKGILINKKLQKKHEPVLFSEPGYIVQTNFLVYYYLLKKFKFKFLAKSKFYNIFQKPIKQTIIYNLQLYVYLYS